MDSTAYQAELINRVLASIEKHHGGSFLSSIVLTGSFGRNEPTYICSPQGEMILKSDVEIALIFPRFWDFFKVEKLIENVCGEFQEELNLMPISERRVRCVYNFNYSFRIPKFKTLFVYDFFNGSKTIWGKDFLKSRHVGLEQVAPYEAKRLVANRIGELVMVGQTGDDLSRQWKCKVLLAIAAAWLIDSGAYVSSYHGQFDAMMNNREKVSAQLGDDFFRDYVQAFRFLREQGAPCEIDDCALRRYVKQMDESFQRKGLTAPQVNSTSREIKYFLRYAQCGFPKGLLHYENRILQDLIAEYADASPDLLRTAQIWKKVMY